MEIHQLKTFYSVAAHLNFTKAAEELSLSQPAVSRQIEALESYYKLPLFYRTKKRVELTDAGRQLLRYAIQIISLADQAEKSLLSLSNLESGDLSVGCGTTIGTFVIINMVIEFQKKHPNIRVNLVIDNTSTIIEKLTENQIDLAIVAKSMNDSRFNYQPLLQDRISAYCSFQAKEKYEDIQSLKDLENETILLRENGSHTRECVQSEFDKSNFKPKNIFEVTSNEGIKQAILNNSGIGFLSSTTVRTELKHDLMFEIPLLEECKREFSIITPKGKYPSPILLIFSSFLLKNTRRLI
ncbi:LysR family transcriptional regulator [Bacillus infantis]|uniref:LysR family transcriptional regulator n=1 Tax=Bacillus infantis TaxID=324767 RepID=UPI003CF8A3A7